MTDNMDKKLRIIAENAAKLGAIHDEQESAYSDQTAAEAELLDTVVEAVRPALRALSSRVQIAEREWWPDTTGRVYDETYSPDIRALRVDGDGPSCDYPTANRGAYTGQDVFLTSDGRWLRADYSGSWSRWQGEEGGWSAEITELTSMEVADDWLSTSIVSEITDALERQLSGKRSRSTDAARARAEQFRSLAALLKGGR